MALYSLTQFISVLILYTVSIREPQTPSQHSSSIPPARSQGSVAKSPVPSKAHVVLNLRTGPEKWGHWLVLSTLIPEGSSLCVYACVRASQDAVHGRMRQSPGRVTQSHDPTLQALPCPAQSMSCLLILMAGVS